MTGSRRALIRVEAGATIGLGHVRRMMSLAAALAEERYAATFLVGDLAAVAAVTGADAVTKVPDPLWGAADAAFVIAAAERTDAQLVIVDSYSASPAYLEQLRGHGFLTVEVQDAEHMSAAEVILRPTIVFGASNAGTPVTLAGAECVLLRPEFWALPAREPRTRVAKVLLTLGGGDPQGRSVPLFAELLRVLVDVEVHCVAGPYFSNDTRAELHAITAAAGGRARVIESPVSAADLWRDADVVVSAGGQTLYELAATGTPAIAIEVALNQREQVAALAAAGAVVSAGTIDDPQIAALAAAAASALIADDSRRAAMRRCGARLIDGRGALRVAKALVSLSRRPS